jgi:hypothetical protein
MLPELLPSPWAERFDSLVESACTSLVLCSPYIGRGPCERIARRSAAAGRPALRVSVLTELSSGNILSGATDVAALAAILECSESTEVRFLPSLHAKVYIADETSAVVTSANMTDSGLSRNLEYGVLFRDRGTVREIRADVLRYARLGSPARLSELQALARDAEELVPLQRRAERSARAALRRELARRRRAMETGILRARVAGRSAHAIFADAVLHLLQKGPMATDQIHHAIQRIHPDLCDDTVDRVIDGQHFGKKWKHAVRTAQAHLKKRGEIRLDGDTWRRTEGSRAAAL